MLVDLDRGGSSRKNLGGGGMAPWIRDKKEVWGQSPQQIVLDHAIFALRNRPILPQRLATYKLKSCKNEKATMKESRQNDREIKSTGR